MAITITRDLNVVSVGVPPVIHLSQYDSDFTLVFNLYASTGAFTMPTGTTAEIRGTKRDGNGYNAAASVSGSTVTVTGDEQMTAIAGQNMFEIATYYNNKRLNTINFILDVERAALDADTITSESVLRELDAIIQGAATATQAAEDAENAADRAEEAADDLSGTVQQVATNTQDIAGLKDDLGEITVNWTDGKYVSKLIGNEVNGGYSVTDYIQCYGADVAVKVEMYNDNSGICFYDADKVFISGINANANNYTLFDLTIPTNACYVRISTLTRYKTNAVVKRKNALLKLSEVDGNTNYNVNQISIKVDNIETVFEKSNNLLTINGNAVTVLGVDVTYSDGSITLSGTGTGNGGRTIKLTPIISLAAGTYTFWAKNANAGFFIENASNDSIIAPIAQGNSWSYTFTLAGETSVYLGVNIDSGTTYSFTGSLMLEKGTIKTSYQKPSYLCAKDFTARKALAAIDEFWAYAMGNVLCIGDSLTSGACYTGNWGGNSIDQNYPKLLSRMIRADVTNGGVSGLTASQWYDNEISKYTLSDYDTFIIWLGTNGGLTDTLDTDVNPYDDYNDFANTNTGNYCKIVERIKANNSDCLIVLTKVFVSDTTNEVIDKIATKYSLPVIDNSDLTVDNYPYLHGNINNVHFTKTGNLFIADRYVKKLGEIFAVDPSITDYGLTARTN